MLCFERIVDTRALFFWHGFIMFEYPKYLLMFGMPPLRSYHLVYQYGFPQYKRPRKMFAKVTADSLDLYITKLPFWLDKISIAKDDILEVDLDSETYRSAGKAAAGAIAGGVLTGGIGLIAGAAIGGKRRKENTLQLAVRYQNKTCVLGIKPNKKAPQLFSDIKHLLS